MTERMNQGFVFDCGDAEKDLNFLPGHLCLLKKTFIDGVWMNVNRYRYIFRTENYFIFLGSK